MYFIIYGFNYKIVVQHFHMKIDKITKLFSSKNNYIEMKYAYFKSKDVVKVKCYRFLYSFTLYKF